MIMFVRRFYTDREFKVLLVIVAITLLVGTLFYHHYEGWRALDALYFSATVTAVGYGDFIPKTDTGKIFTMFYIFFGLGVILAFINVIAKHTIRNYTRLTESYIRRTEEYFEGVVEKAIRKK